MHLCSPLRLRPYQRDYGATLSPFGYETRSKLAKAGDAIRTRDIFLGKEDKFSREKRSYLEGSADWYGLARSF
jgi:hypothetical protein